MVEVNFDDRPQRFFIGTSLLNVTVCLVDFGWIAVVSKFRSDPQIRCTVDLSVVNIVNRFEMVEVKMARETTGNTRSRSIPVGLLKDLPNGLAVLNT